MTILLRTSTHLNNSLARLKFSGIFPKAKKDVTLLKKKDGTPPASSADPPPSPKPPHRISPTPKKNPYPTKITPPPPPPQKKTSQTQRTNAKIWHESWNITMELRECGNAIRKEYEIRINRSVTPGLQRQWVKMGVYLRVDVSELAERKQTKLELKSVLLEIHSLSKLHTNRSILGGDVAKIRYCTSLAKSEERCPTEPKLTIWTTENHLKKYILGDFSLQMELNEPIRAVKVSFFTFSNVETWNVQVTKRSKWQ